MAIRFAGFSATGQFEIAFTDGLLDNATGLVFNGAELLVSSFSNDRVLRFDPNTGAPLGEFVPFQANGLREPQGLATDDLGNILVVSSF